MNIFSFLFGGFICLTFIACIGNWIVYVSDKQKATTKREFILQFIIPFYWGIKYMIDEYRKFDK